MGRRADGREHQISRHLHVLSDRPAKAEYPDRPVKTMISFAPRRRGRPCWRAGTAAKLQEVVEGHVHRRKQAGASGNLAATPWQSEKRMATRSCSHRRCSTGNPTSTRTSPST